MKKLIAFILCCAICAVLAACGSGSGSSPSDSVSRQSDSAVENISGQEETSTEASQEETNEEVPLHIQKFYDLLKEYTENNEVSFYLEGNKPFYDDPYFRIQINNNPDNLPTDILFSVGDDMQAEKSFYMNFDIHSDNQMVKDFICASLYATSPQKGNEDIIPAMQELVNSYNGDSFSQVLDNGDCVLFIEPADKPLGITTLYLRYKDEYHLGNRSYSAEDYSELVFENALSEMNKGDLIYFSGTVIESGYEDIYGKGWKNYFIKSELENGQNVYAVYTFQYSPVQFEVGKNYQFYGNIADPIESTIPVISLHDYSEQ